MTDMETIIKGCENWVNNHEGQNFLLTYSSIVELLALLKEQEEKIRQLKLALQIMNGNGIRVDTESR